MPAKKPVPGTNSEVEREFWRRMTAGEVPVQHCSDCGHDAFPPRLLCPECFSEDWEFREISGGAEVYGYTVIHRPSKPAFEDEIPIVSAVVELAEGPRVMGMVECDPDAVSVGTPVELSPDNLGDDDVRLVFRPVE